MSLVPGAMPPIVTPFCKLCELPAERFVMDVVTSPYYVGLHVSCCGKTTSFRISLDEVRRLRATNEKLWVVMPKGRTPGIRPMPKLFALAYERGK